MTSTDISTPAAELQRIDKDHAALCRRLAKLQADIGVAIEEAESIKDRLRELAAGDWTDAKGVPLVRITPQRRFDPMIAINYLTDEQMAGALAAPAWDAAKVKQHLTPAQLDACMVESGKPKVGLLL